MHISTEKNILQFSDKNIVLEKYFRHFFYVKIYVNLGLHFSDRNFGFRKIFLRIMYTQKLLIPLLKLSI